MSQPNEAAAVPPARDAQPDASPTAARQPNIAVHDDPALETRGLCVFYGEKLTIDDISITIPRHRITAFIGPSGSGKSTVLRSFNRMNDLIRTARVEGAVLFEGEDIYEEGVDPVEVRRRIGMVFQKPNPFPKSIFENVAFGLRINSYTGDIEERVERALRQAALWDEVKDRLKANALSLSGGQQQRLCIARALAVEPDVILMDEPASALDPLATAKIEELMHELKREFTIVIVTHNMQQAARVADFTAFMNLGELIEYDDTEKIFTNPDDERTEQYITGRFG